VVRVRIWSADGTLLWADDRQLVGRRFPLTADQQRALRTGTAGAGEPDPAAPGGATAPDADRLLDAYTGLTTASGRRLLVDFAEPWDAVRAPDRQAWLRVTAVALGGLVLVELVQVPLAWRVARRWRRAQDAEAELLEATGSAAERERRRIAAELHDHVVQDLTGLAYDLDAARLRGTAGGDEGELLAARTAARLRAGIDELRGVLVSLQAPRPPAEGLDAGLTALGADLERAGLHVSVRTSDAERIPSPVAATVHRAAQEALRNVRSHSHATHVDLTVRCEGDWATMVVEDDGSGFDATRLRQRAADGHLGLRTLGDLLTGAGGTLTAASAPGEGTRLAVWVPLDRTPTAVPR
jgi:signal transduction histidine kinase